MTTLPHLPDLIPYPTQPRVITTPSPALTPGPDTEPLTHEQQVLSRFFMLLRQLTLTQDIREVMRFMPIGVLDPLEALGCSLLRIEDDGYQSIIANGGAIGELWEFIDNQRALGVDPILAALRQDKIIITEYQPTPDHPTSSIYIVTGISTASLRLALLIQGRRRHLPLETTESFLSAVLSLLLLELRLSTKVNPTPLYQNIPIDNGPLLSQRQRQVLELIAENLTYAQMANRLGYSESTIKQEAMRIFRKLGVSSRTEAALHLLQNSSESPH